MISYKVRGERVFPKHPIAQTNRTIGPPLLSLDFLSAVINSDPRVRATVSWGGYGAKT